MCGYGNEINYTCLLFNGKQMKINKHVFLNFPKVIQKNEFFNYNEERWDRFIQIKRGREMTCV